MQTWLKANGGPLALVVVGLGVGGLTNRTVGLILILLGVVGFVMVQPPVARYFGIGEHPLAASDPTGDLLVEVLRQEWHTFGELLISVLEARVTNQTDVRKDFSGIAWEGPFMFMFRAGVSMQERQALAREEEKMLDAKARLLTPQKVLLPKDSIRGWAVHTWDLPTGPNIATPAYTLMAYDELRREYRVDVPETRRKG